MVMASTAIYRLELSATFYEFDLEMSRRGFIGPRVLRPRMVGIQAADVGKIKLEQLLQKRNTLRAPGAGYNRSQWEFDKYNYSTDERGVEEPIDDHNLAIFKDLFDAEAISSQRAQDGVMRDYEENVAAAVMNSTTWTGATLTGAVSNKWSVAASATPVQDIETAKRAVRVNSGLEPNCVVLNYINAWDAANSAEIVDRIKFSGYDDPKKLSDFAQIANLLAQIWSVKYVLIAGGHQNTANMGQARAISRIWPDAQVMVARVAETDDPREPCIGRTFMWSEDGASAPGTEEEIAVLVEEYREEWRRGSVIRARTNYDLEIMYPEAGFLLTNIE